MNRRCSQPTHNIVSGLFFISPRTTESGAVRCTTCFLFSIFRCRPLVCARAFSRAVAPPISMVVAAASCSYPLDCASTPVVSGGHAGKLSPGHVHFSFTPGHRASSPHLESRPLRSDWRRRAGSALRRPAHGLVLRPLGHHCCGRNKCLQRADYWSVATGMSSCRRRVASRLILKPTLHLP